MQTPILYEAIFGTMIAVMAVISAAIIVTLRLLLRRWNSVGGKTFLIHLVNIIVLNFAAPAATYLPFLGFVGLVNGTPLAFGLLLMAADWVRAAYAGRLRLAGRGPARAWITFGLIFGLAVTAARVTVRSDEGKDGLGRYTWAAAVARKVRSEPPSREFITVMWETYPAETNAIFRRYVEQTHADFKQAPDRFAMPRFPLQEVQKLLLSKREAILHAPDAELAAYVKAAALAIKDIGRFPRTCASAAIGGGVVWEEPGMEEAAPEVQTRRLGQLIAATLRAARAGTDHPVARRPDPRAIQVLVQQFAAKFSPSLDLSVADPVRSMAERPRCRLFLSYVDWLAALPPDQIADIVVYGHQFDDPDETIYAATPYSLVSLAALRPPHAQLKTPGAAPH